MTQEDKNILLKDLCMRLPYDIKAYFKENIVDIISVKIGVFNSVLICKDAYTDRTSWEGIEKVKPYLRPMSSMAEEEADEYDSLNAYESGVFPHTEEAFDWLNAHHFDYRGLIPMGLALESPEGMYKNE